MRKTLATAALIVAFAPSPGPAQAPDPTTAVAVDEVDEWAREVDLLLTDEERAALAQIDRGYQRQAFMRAFWKVRDPFPETGRNEFRETWEARVALARERFGGLEGDRARVMLLSGPPDQIWTSPCPQRLEPLDVWVYASPGRRGQRHFLVFVRSSRSADGYRLWEPMEGVDSLATWSSRTRPAGDSLVTEIADSCPRGGEMAAVLSGAIGWRTYEDDLVRVPRPPAEWVPTFLSRSTEVPAGAGGFEADIRISFPGRRQSRTVVQTLLDVPGGPEMAAQSPDGGLHFTVDGEVLKEGSIFERFRYRFDLTPDELRGDHVPLVIQRFLRPGTYTLVIKAEETASQRYFRVERRVRVPKVAQAAQTASTASTAPAAPAVATATAPDAADPGDLFAEANAGISADDYRIQIRPLPERLLTGRVRVEAVPSSNDIVKVAFELNGKRVVSKSRPPFSVELDVGHAPDLHRLEVVGFDAAGNELARDSARVNAGPHRFAVRLVEPRSGRRYDNSLRAVAEVDLPIGDELDRVEFFLNEELVATLYQSPFVQPLLLPRSKKTSYVRVLAHLADGNSTEDLVFVNAPREVDRVNVNFVELFTSVTDRSGQPIDDLEPSEVTVLEDGVEQKIVRFERIRDLPIHAGVLLDVSASMAEEMREAESAALRFFESVIRPKDRAAVIVFADDPELRVPFTNNLEVLAGGLAGIEADGYTTLYDSLVYGLYYFAGIRGKRALVVISDGEDSRSGHTFRETLEFARRSGTAVYTVGLKLGTRDVEQRHVLRSLATETGGRAFFIDRASGLGRIYEIIETDLRTQYLLGYQAPLRPGEEFREVEVKVKRPGVQATTIPGYYP